VSLILHNIFSCSGNVGANYPIGKIKQTLLIEHKNVVERLSLAFHEQFHRLTGREEEN